MYNCGAWHMKLVVPVTSRGTLTYPPAAADQGRGSGFRPAPPRKSLGTGCSVRVSEASAPLFLSTPPVDFVELMPIPRAWKCTSRHLEFLAFEIGSC
jgi:hypothetical protein